MDNYQSLSTSPSHFSGIAGLVVLGIFCLLLLSLSYHTENELIRAGESAWTDRTASSGCPIYTYYEPQNDDKSDLAMLTLWLRNRFAHRQNPVILTSHNAEANPKHHQFMRTIERFAGKSDPRRYKRWLAIEQLKRGGTLCDYNVMALAKTACSDQRRALHFSAQLFPLCATGGRQHYEKFVDAIASFRPQPDQFGSVLPLSERLVVLQNPRDFVLDNEATDTNGFTSRNARQREQQLGHPVDRVAWANKVAMLNFLSTKRIYILGDTVPDLLLPLLACEAEFKGSRTRLSGTPKCCVHHIKSLQALDSLERQRTEHNDENFYVFAVIGPAASKNVLDAANALGRSPRFIAGFSDDPAATKLLFEYSAGFVLGPPSAALPVPKPLVPHVRAEFERRLEIIRKIESQLDTRAVPT